MAHYGRSAEKNSILRGHKVSITTLRWSVYASCVGVIQGKSVFLCNHRDHKKDELDKDHWEMN